MSISDSAPYEILQYTPSGTISACAPKPLSEISKEELEVIALLAINEYKQNSTTNGLTISDFKVGDVVVINGWRGTVQTIGIRTTKIIDAAGNVNIVNNSSISNIINNTKELSVAIITCGIDYQESLERVEAILKDYQSSIESSFKRIDKKLDLFDKYDKNQKKSAITSLKQ